MIMIPAILLTSISGIGTIASSSSSRCDANPHWLTIGFGAAAIVSSTLITLHKFLDIATLQQEHDLYSDMFENLANETPLQIALCESTNKTYTNVEEFAKIFKRSMDMLNDKAPPILAWVETAFQKKPLEFP
jgi:hypothetical protein